MTHDHQQKFYERLHVLNQNVPSDIEIKIHQQIAVEIQKVNISSAFTKVTTYVLILYFT